MKQKKIRPKRPLKFVFDEMFYLKWFDNGGYYVVRKSDGKVLARDVWSFSWSETWGIRNSNSMYADKIMQEAEKVMLIKR